QRGGCRDCTRSRNHSKQHARGNKFTGGKHGRANYSCCCCKIFRNGKRRAGDAFGGSSGADGPVQRCCRCCCHLRSEPGGQRGGCRIPCCRGRTGAHGRVEE